MSRKIRTSLLVPLLIGFAASVSAFEELGTVSLEPMERPSVSPFENGTEIHWLKNGKSSTYYFESIDAGTYTVRWDDGCRSTRLMLMYAPSLEWNHCEYASASQKITETRGNPWPLSAKTEFQYAYIGNYRGDLGQPWQSIWKCKVDKQVRVEVPAGEYDTFKLICEDDLTVRTYWISPELRHHVALEEKSKIYISRWYLLEFVEAVKP